MIQIKAKATKLNLSKETLRTLASIELEATRGGQRNPDSIVICPGTLWATCDGTSCVFATCHCPSTVPQSCDVTCTGTVITFGRKG